MAMFCTKCGTPNEDGAGFCENCGSALRPKADPSPSMDQRSALPNTHVHSPLPGGLRPEHSKRIVYAAVGLVGLLAVGGLAAYLVLRAPAATGSALLAAARAGYGKETTDRFKNELCLSNTDYSQGSFNAGESDQGAQAWMNALVAAGLYSPAVTINSGGVYSRILLQYTATPELQKYRQGSRLCAAKDVEFAEVTDIEKPQEQPLGPDAGAPRVLAVKTKLVLKSLDTAPWMTKPEVREAFMANLNGWEYNGGSLQKKIVETFGLQDNKWTTGTAYQASLEKQVRAARRAARNDQEGKSVAAKASSGGFGSAFSNLFSFGNPLKGTWRTAPMDMGFGKMAAGAGPSLTFTSDAMETSGQSTAVDYSVDGKRIKVTPKGQSQSFIFVMEGPDTVVAEALGNMRYERVK
jgi:hypothetical protein